MHGMTGKDANIYTFKKKATAIAMRMRSNLEPAAELLTVDPAQGVLTLSFGVSKAGLCCKDFR